MIPVGAKGVLEIPLTKYRYFTVVGGPFRNCPLTMHGVKMAAEIQQACDIDIPTRDFQTPDRKVFLAGLTKAVDLLLDGEPLYVGCYAGQGRTGLFLSLLVKAFRVKHPVEYVRKHYYPHAVETREQYEWVMKFKIPPTIYAKIKKARKTPVRMNQTRPERKGGHTSPGYTDHEKADVHNQKVQPSGVLGGTGVSKPWYLTNA